MAVALFPQAQVSFGLCEPEETTPIYLEAVMRIRRNRKRERRAQRCEHGFTMIQLLITLAIIAIVSTLAVMGITRARAHMRLSASERALAGYLEQIRTDSIRRHASVPVNAGDPDVRAVISISAQGGNTYTVTMDFDKDGTLDAARTITLESGVKFSTSSSTIRFDWRGRAEGEVSIGLINDNNDTGNINVTGSGDVTLDTEVFYDNDIPDIALNNNNVSGDVI